MDSYRKEERLQTRLSAIEHRASALEQCIRAIARHVKDPELIAAVEQMLTAERARRPSA